MNSPKLQKAKGPTARKRRTGKGAVSKLVAGDVLDEIRAQWIKSGRRGDFDFSELVLGITIVAQVMEREFNRYATSKFGMSPGDVRILLTLRRAQVPMRPTDLFKQLVITPGAITKQVDRLVARGFVSRAFNSKNKRGWHIVLTDAGQTITNQATSNDAMPTMWIVFNALTDAQRSKALRIMHLLVGKIQERIRHNPVD